MKTACITPQLSIRLKFPVTLALGLVAALFVSGCVVTSVYPFYHPNDVIFDPALLGVWAEAAKSDGDKENWTFEKTDDRTYKLITVDGDKKSEFDARLFKLKEHQFLDCLPRERTEGGLPLHHLMRVEAVSPGLEFRLLDYGWLGKLVEKDPRAIRHIVVPKTAGEGDGGNLVLTADTAELQKFLRKHLKTADAWTEPVVMKQR